MTSDTQIRLRSGQTWLRLVLVLIYFFVIFEVVVLLVGLAMVFQFFYRLVKGAEAERLRAFTGDLNTFRYAALQYVTFNSDERPFPFCDWPAPEEQDDSSIRY